MSEKVGTELGKLIPKWAIKSDTSCKCRDVAAKMDKWGVDGCIAKRDWIINHLIAQDEHLIPALKLIPKSAKKIVAARMLGKAIRAARA